MIGVFDSTIGGLTIARAFEQLLPRHSLLYLGDTARASCEDMGNADIVQYSIENTKFLIENGAKIIVIGCNSAAGTAAETVRQTFDVPVFDIITPAVQEAVRVSHCKRIGIIGTHATIASNIYSDTVTGLFPEYKVFSKSCPLLVPLIEEGWISKKETKMILKKYLSSLKNRQLDTLILGCNHYSLLKQLIQPRIGKKVTLVDSAFEVAKEVRSFLQDVPDMLPPEEISEVRRHYFITRLTETTEYVAEKIFARPTLLQLT